MTAPDLWRKGALGAGLALTLLLAACAVQGGYGPPLLGLDYYEPYDMVYGGWYGGYHVAPYRGGRFGTGGAGVHFHAAPRSRTMPSIPSRARPAGGGRGGGGRR